MKKIIFTLLLAAALQNGYSQITYYWVGGAAPSTTSFNSSGNWNTTIGGGGSPRTTPLATDILIFDGSDVDDDPGIQAGPVVFGFSAPPANTGPSQLKFQSGIDVTLKRGSVGGTTTLNVGVGNTLDNDPDFVVAAASTLRIANPDASLVIALDANATGEVNGDIFMVENSNSATSPNPSQNRLTAKGVRSLRFMSGSAFNTLAAYHYYPFGSGGSVLPAPNGVVFESGSIFNFSGGWSPFGGSTSQSVVEFRPGSKFFFHAPPEIAYNATTPITVTNMFANRSYPDVIIDNNATVTADGSGGLYRIDSLRIATGSTFNTSPAGSTPINLSILNNGTLTTPAGGRLVMAGSTLQNISGTGSYTLSEFNISNQSIVKLLKSVQVETATNILGALDASTNGITGAGTITTKSPAVANVTGTTVNESNVVTDVSSPAGIEVGMSVTGPGIALNTVVIGISTGATTSITLSKPATAAGASQPLVIFNGQGVLPVKFGNISASVKNGQVDVNWQIFTEDNINRYGVERSQDGRQFSEIGSVKAAGKSSYSFTDVTPLSGVGFYRIRAVGNDGETKYSSVMKVSSAKGKADFSVYPNPVKDGSINVQLSNLTKGSYTLNLFNSLGQSTFSKTISFDGGSLNQSIALPSSVKAGVYRLTLKGMDITLHQTILVQ